MFRYLVIDINDKLRRIIKNAIYVAIIVSLEYTLMFLPNIQFTMLLLCISATTFTYKDTLMIIIAYVLIDNMLIGGIGLYTIPMLVGWILATILFYVKRESNETSLALFSIIATVLYSVPFIIFHYILFGTVGQYIISDIPFVIVMALSSYVSILLLYKKIKEVIKWNY